MQNNLHISEKSTNFAHDFEKNMASLDELFHQKHTENGDLSYNSTGRHLLDILFTTEYLQKHPGEVRIGTSDKERLFSMFIRDPRYGLGRRDLGRVLMRLSECSPVEVVTAGRFDDLLFTNTMNQAFEYWKQEIDRGNELAKKWAPRYSSKNLLFARMFASYLKMNKQQYGHYVKCNTTENKLSRKTTEQIIFEHVPSLAMIKYYKRFLNGSDTKERFAKYLEDVKAGKKELHISTTTVYDIYRNMHSIDADLFFSKIEKIALSCIPIVDSSGSMQDDNDSYGKAMAIGHYLAKCSTYAPNKVISFSSHPKLITLGEHYCALRRMYATEGSQYEREIKSMHTGDYTNTDFGAVLELLKGLDEWPDYFVVLSDMEFDRGSNQKKDEVERMFKAREIPTKIIWWNLNARNITIPEMDKNGNIYMSGYSPMLLQFLQAGFNGEMFLNTLLQEYSKNIHH